MKFLYCKIIEENPNKAIFRWIFLYINFKSQVRFCENEFYRFLVLRLGTHLRFRSILFTTRANFFTTTNIKDRCKKIFVIYEQFYRNISLDFHKNLITWKKKTPDIREVRIFWKALVLVFMYSFSQYGVYDHLTKTLRVILDKNLQFLPFDRRGTTW